MEQAKELLEELKIKDKKKIKAKTIFKSFLSFHETYEI